MSNTNKIALSSSPTTASYMSKISAAMNDESEMFVTKRNGDLEIVSFDKILTRVKTIGQQCNLKLNYTGLVMKVIDQLYDKIETKKIDDLSAEQCASMASIHPDYNTLAGHIAISSHHKDTNPSFSQVMTDLYKYTDKHGKHSPIISPELYELVIANATLYDKTCDFNRDFLIDYFGFKTLERSYLMRINGTVVERPQHLWMRVALGIHMSDTEKAFETYEYMSNKYFTHATPTLFNAGTPHPQLSSCYLLATEEDSLDGIFNTLKDCATISKWAGGIGLHIHNVRATGSHIRGTNGTSNGIVPMLKVFNNTAKYINQGGKRNGSFAIYLEPWHADIEIFMEMRKNHGDEEMKARDLFYALWIPDLFMERVKQDGPWTLMCPDECPGLSDVYGDEFVRLYESYETAGRGRATIKARDIWFKILDSQMETGTPYMLYKDAANRKSNQKNLGTIKSSNLCVAPETVILTDRGHIEIQALANQIVNVWNGHEYSEVVIRKTGIDQNLLNVYTDDGLKLACTPYHKFYIQNDTYSLYSQRLVEARHLKPGDKIIQCDYPVIDGPDKITLYDRTEIPLHTSSLNIKLEWFALYCDTHATVETGEYGEEIRIASTNSHYLTKIKLLLQTCGINPRINVVNDGTRGYNDCGVTEVDHLFDNHPWQYRLTVNPWDLYRIIGFGFRPSLLEIIGLVQVVQQPESTKTVQILKVEYTNRISDTYCFTEHKQNVGIFNGMITSQCTEIIEYSDSNETAVCNLASIALPAFVRKDEDDGAYFDFAELHKVSGIITRNLNRIIDINFYPTEKTRTSNMRHRPIGIGVQGLADVFLILNIAFYSQEAKEMNRQIFETIYHGALTESMELSKSTGPYESFEGSPASQGVLQFDLWDAVPESEYKYLYDWSQLKADIMEFGLRNSLLLAPMPTASTSQILGFNECIEPITSNIYSRRTLAGEFILANKYLMHDLIKLDMWNEKIKNNIVANHGSIQHIESIPQEIKDKYRTVWEIPMKHLIDMSADRGVFICQSQSLNLWMEDPNYNSLTSMHFYSWTKGLKTGIYYLRRRGKHQAQQFTIEPEKNDANHGEEHEICEFCSS